jgi:hypothetical protein
VRRHLEYMPFVFAIALAGFVASGVLATVHGPERPR